jgi:hypothetical protein
MNNEKISLEENIRNNFVVWVSMLIGQVFFCAIAVFLVNNGAMGIIDHSNLNEILIYIVPSIAIICIFSGFYIFKQRLLALKELTDINAKFTNYKSALIIRWALIEGPSFLAIVSYLLTGNYILLGIAVTIIVIFILFMPNKARTEADLELSWLDENKL